MTDDENGDLEIESDEYDLVCLKYDNDARELIVELDLGYQHGIVRIPQDGLNATALKRAREVLEEIDRAIEGFGCKLKDEYESHMLFRKSDPYERGIADGLDKADSMFCELFNALQPKARSVLEQG